MTTETKLQAVLSLTEDEAKEIVNSLSTEYELSHADIYNTAYNSLDKSEVDTEEKHFESNYTVRSNSWSYEQAVGTDYMGDPEFAGSAEAFVKWLLERELLDPEAVLAQLSELRGGNTNA